MSSLLTFNGIPPQIIGSLTPEQRGGLVTRLQTNEDKKFPSADGKAFNAFSEMAPFEQFAADAAERFTLWGAKYLEGSLRIISTQLGVGKSTFNEDDLQPHSDARHALERLHNKGFLILRALCVSSMPATFIDLTGQKDPAATLEPHRTDADRIYKPSLMDWAETHHLSLTPKPWDVIIFDGFTPHRPATAREPHRRIFQQAWMEFELPQDWEKRVARGDGPRWKPTYG